MPKAGTIERITLYRRSAGFVAVTGKVLADFSFPSWLDGVATVLTVTGFTEIGSGYYSVDLTMPATTGRIRIDFKCSNPTSDTCDVAGMDGRVENNDLDSITLGPSATVVVTSGVRRKTPYAIEVYKGDGINLQIPIYDDNANLVDLTLWQNFRFSIQNEAQTTVIGQFPYHQTSGVSGAGDGLLTVSLPEDCQVYAAHLAGHKKTTLYWSADANLISEGVTKTRTLRAGTFVILPKETGV